MRFGASIRGRVVGVEMAEFREIPGVPFPVAYHGTGVPLSWFLAQGAPPETICEVLDSRSWIAHSPDELRGGVVDFDRAWWLLDELISRGAFPGPIHPFKEEPFPPDDESPFDYLWR